MLKKKKPTLVFNHSNLTFEQRKLSWRDKLLNIVLIASGIIVFTSTVVIISHKVFPSPNEQELLKRIAFLQKQFKILERNVDNVTTDLGTLRERDENLYRVIYQRDPIAENIWKTAEKDSGQWDIFKEYSNYEVLGNILQKLNLVRKRMNIQRRSYNELAILVEKKDEMINSIPSIQPLTNKELTKISSGFGYRIHPIYRIPKMHTGIDFTAPIGTDIYASGDGVIEKSSNTGNGYGNEIVINHGYGYKSRYAHLSRYYISFGQRVKRGQKIGAVGSTGASVGPHLHYEVEYMDSKVDPALFFYNDLDAKQYQEMLKITNAGGKSFD
jgi:murein DD-endopeptidase MepM/ murein hydrolase activator NlpD